MKNLLFAGTALLCLISGPALSQDRELEAVNQTAFRVVDVNKDGKVSRREAEHYRKLVMISMDRNDDGIVTRAEYMSWDMGWQHLAGKRGRLAQYRQAREKVFRIWDHNGDGQLTPSEQRDSHVRDFFEASGGTNRPLSPSQFAKGLRIIAEMNKVFTAGEPVTLINVFTVPEGREADALAFWEAAAKFLRTQPGYISTALHKSILPGAKYALINVAKWASVAAFNRATAAMRKSAGLKPVAGLTFDAALYTVIRAD